MKTFESLLVSTELHSDPKHLKKIRQLVRRAACSACCSDKVVQNSVLAVNEAAMNIIQHAYQGEPDGVIIMEIRKRGQSLEFLLTDYGLPACPEKIKPRALDDIRPGGLGCHFIKEVMDEVEYLPLQDKTGNQLRMVKHIS